MIIGRIPGATRVCGKSQGFLGLPIKDDVVDVPMFGICNQMTTAWEPTPAELERIARGAPVLIKIIGATPPPMLVEVGDAPE